MIEVKGVNKTKKIFLNVSSWLLIGAFICFGILANRGNFLIETNSSDGISIASSSKSSSVFQNPNPKGSFFMELEEVEEESEDEHLSLKYTSTSIQNICLVHELSYAQLCQYETSLISFCSPAKVPLYLRNCNLQLDI